MQVRHYAQGKFYTVACPEGTRLVRGVDGRDLLAVPLKDEREAAIPADPPELLPLLAESRRCGLRLVCKPEPGALLAGARCPRCGETDVEWLQADVDRAVARCDRCQTEFAPRASTPSMNRIWPSQLE